MEDHALEVLSPNEAPDLDTLAKQIDAAHVAGVGVLLSSVQLAAEAGHLLAQAKVLSWPKIASDKKFPSVCYGLCSPWRFDSEGQLSR